MPRSAIASGVADFILPVRDIAAHLPELVRKKLQLQAEDLGEKYEQSLGRWIFGFIWILNQDQAAALPDGLYANGPVGPGTGQDDGKVVPVLLRHGPEKEIYGCPLAAWLIER